MTEQERGKAWRAALEAPDVMESTSCGEPVGDGYSPYTFGPYVVLGDGDSFDSDDGCSIVYVTEAGQVQLEGATGISGVTEVGFRHVENSEKEVIPMKDLIAAYNKVHGTDL
jgi:hypothetical protein